METKKLKGGKTDIEFVVQLVVIAVLGILLFYNGAKFYGMTGNSIATGVGMVSAEVLPQGTPQFYGEKLGVSYDDVSLSDPRLADATIRKLSQYENMELNSEQMQRYIQIAGAISCEYCCGAKAIIFSNGERACGCAHSYAMRGLAKYLLTENPEMSDEEILSELGKWKVLFFPGIHEQKAQVLETNGIDSMNYINLASNMYRGIEKGQLQGGSMVGGC